MAMFVTSLILIALGVGALAARTLTPARAKTGEDLPARGRLALSSIGLVGLGALLMLWSVVYIVPTQQVGIPVTFGKPGDAQGNGIHVKAPWTRVVEMDGTIQIDDNLGDKRTEIRLGNQSVAFVQNSVRWRIKPEAAASLYRDYRAFDNIGPALEEQELSSALNEAFKDYNPLNTATGTAPSLDSIADAVKKRLVDRLGDRLVIESVMIPKVDFDQQTQARIDAYQTEIGNTRIAEQREKTAAAEAAANKVLATSVSKDPNVLVSKCLDQLSEMVSKGQAVPAGFSCWPGGGSAVIADASSGTKK